MQTVFTSFSPGSTGGSGLCPAENAIKEQQSVADSQSAGPAHCRFISLMAACTG
jgi:hypothetical protein